MSSYMSGWSQNISMPLWTNATSGTNLPYYVSGVTYAPAPLPSVLDDVRELTDREWLDSQIAEVCELAVSA